MQVFIGAHFIGVFFKEFIGAHFIGLQFKECQMVVDILVVMAIVLGNLAVTLPTSAMLANSLKSVRPPPSGACRIQRCFILLALFSQLISHGGCQC